MGLDDATVAREVAELAGRLRVSPAGADRFVGRTCEVGSQNVYGGQFVGQAVMAAGLTAPGRPVHSMHASFIRPGSKESPVVYRVERTFDGASFSRRRVTAFQEERLLFEADFSLQIAEYGREHQHPMPQVPAPDQLKSERRLAPGLPNGPRTSLWPIEVRVVDEVVDAASGSSWWLRAASALPDDPLLHQALLAYASDYQFLQAATRVHGLRFRQPGLQLASLDHALWFHRPARIDSWLLFSTESPSASGARAFVRGNVFGAGGQLVASVAQEGLMRLRDAAAAG